jgi:hypothetical protein
MLSPSEQFQLNFEQIHLVSRDDTSYLAGDKKPSVPAGSSAPFVGFS